MKASTLTVGDLGGNELGYNGANGSLTDATFVYQHKPYTLQTIRWDSTNNTLQVTAAPTLEDQHRSKLVLHVDEHLLGFEDATISSAGAYQWDVDLDWTAADQVRLRASSPIGGVMTVNTGTRYAGGRVTGLRLRQERRPHSSLQRGRQHVAEVLRVQPLR